jgi:hypothetical protein
MGCGFPALVREVIRLYLCKRTDHQSRANIIYFIKSLSYVFSFPFILIKKVD